MGFAVHIVWNMFVIGIKPISKNIAYSAPKPRVAYAVYYLEIKKKKSVALILLASTAPNNSVCTAVMKIDINSLFAIQKLERP